MKAEMLLLLFCDGISDMKFIVSFKHHSQDYFWGRGEFRQDFYDKLLLKLEFDTY